MIPQPRLTPQEKIKLLKNMDTFSEDEDIAIEYAVEAISKTEIPLVPEPDDRYYGNGKCPRCKAVFLDKTTKYCGECGQKIDWS